MRVKDIINKAAAIKGGLYSKMLERIDSIKIDYFSLEKRFPDIINDINVSVYYNKLSNNVELRLVTDDGKGVFILRWLGYGNAKIEFIRLRESFSNIADNYWIRI